MKYRLPPAASIAVLIVCCMQGSLAQAQTFDFKNVVSVNGPPVVVNQSSQFNMTGLFMVGGNTSGTVVQTGTTNAVGILQFLWTWNALLLPMLFLRSDIPLPVLLARISGSYEVNWDQRSVAAIITTVVPLVVFLVFQRQFAAGSQTRTGAKE